MQRERAARWQSELAQIYRVSGDRKREWQLAAWQREDEQKLQEMRWREQQQQREFRHEEKIVGIKAKAEALEDVAKSKKDQQMREALRGKYGESLGMTEEEWASAPLSHLLGRANTMESQSRSEESVARKAGIESVARQTTPAEIPDKVTSSDARKWYDDAVNVVRGTPKMDKAGKEVADEYEGGRFTSETWGTLSDADKLMHVRDTQRQLMTPHYSQEALDEFFQRTGGRTIKKPQFRDVLDITDDLAQRIGRIPTADEVKEELESRGYDIG